MCPSLNSLALSALFKGDNKTKFKYSFHNVSAQVCLACLFISCFFPSVRDAICPLNTPIFQMTVHLFSPLFFFPKNSIVPEAEIPKIGGNMILKVGIAWRDNTWSKHCVFWNNVIDRRLFKRCLNGLRVCQDLQDRQLFLICVKQFPHIKDSQRRKIKPSTFLDSERTVSNNLCLLF